MKTLENLWYGNIDPHEVYLKDQHQFKRLLSLLEKSRDALSATLTDNEKELLDKYDEMANEMHSISEIAAFSFGLRLGVKLMVETLDEIPTV